MERESLKKGRVNFFRAQKSKTQLFRRRDAQRNDSPHNDTLRRGEKI
jgi:hypothetical protein